MQTYDGTVIRTFAGKLYASAAWALLIYPVFFGAVGGFAGTQFYGQGGGLGGLITGVVVGYYIASQRAFRLRLLAQTALCQAQIEENTRSSRATSHPPPSSQTQSNEEAPADYDSVKGCVARLVAGGHRVTRAASGGWEATGPSGATAIANSPEELRVLAARHGHANRAPVA